MNRSIVMEDCAEECRRLCTALARASREIQGTMHGAEVHRATIILAEVARRLDVNAQQTEIGTIKRQQLLLSASRVRFGRPDVGGTWDE